MNSIEGEENRRQSRVHFEMVEKEVNALPDRSRSNSSSSYASDLWEKDFSIKTIFNNNSALQPKPDALECPSGTQTPDNKSECLSRVQSSSKGSQVRLSGLMGNHDNRIPGSIFSSKPSNPMDWSTASTESLFSIHVGNNSFSRDHFNFQTKSGELMSTDFPQYSHNLSHFFETTKVESNNENTANDLGANPTFASHNPVDHRKEALKPVEEGTTRNSVSCLSEDNVSMCSARSFKFPVLAGDHGKPASTAVLAPKALPPPKEVGGQQSREITAASSPARSWFFCFTWCSCQ